MMLALTYVAIIRSILEFDIQWGESKTTPCHIILIKEITWLYF